VIDIQQEAPGAAKRFGATDVIDSSKTQPVEPSRLLCGQGAIMSSTSGLKAVTEEGLAMLGIGGGLYLVGVAKPEVDIAVKHLRKQSVGRSVSRA